MKPKEFKKELESLNLTHNEKLQIKLTFIQKQLSLLMMCIISSTLVISLAITSYSVGKAINMFVMLYILMIAVAVILFRDIKKGRKEKDEIINKLKEDRKNATQSTK